MRLGLFDKFLDSLFHIFGLFINGHYGLVFGSVGEIGSINFGWYFKAENVTLFTDLDEDLGVLALAGQIIPDRFQLVEIVTGEAQAPGQFFITFFII